MASMAISSGKHLLDLLHRCVWVNSMLFALRYKDILRITAIAHLQNCIQLRVLLRGLHDCLLWIGYPPEGIHCMFDLLDDLWVNATSSVTRYRWCRRSY